MKRSTFNDNQIAFIIPQAREVTPVEAFCRKAGIICLPTYPALSDSEVKSATEAGKTPAHPARIVLNRVPFTAARPKDTFVVSRRLLKTLSHAA